MVEETSWEGEFGNDKFEDFQKIGVTEEALGTLLTDKVDGFDCGILDHFGVVIEEWDQLD